jgi:hypothetical protein
MVKSRLLFVEILLVLGLFPFPTVHFTRISDRHYLIDRPGVASEITFASAELKWIWKDLCPCLCDV